MRYSFGWWDFIDGPAPTMHNRDTGERVILRKSVTPEVESRARLLHPDSYHKQLRKWAALEYQSGDQGEGTASYSCAVHWDIEGQEVLLDHTVMVETPEDAPPYFLWAQADDMFSDAIIAWPRVSIFSRSGSGFTVSSCGGWCNGTWDVALRSRETGVALVGSPEVETISPASELHAQQSPLVAGASLEQIWGADFGMTGARPAPTPWSFYFGDPAELGAHPGAQLAMQDYSCVRNMLRSQHYACSLASDGSRVLVPNKPTYLYDGVLFNFVYLTAVGTEHLVYVSGDNPRLFSLDPLWEPRGLGSNLRLSYQASSFLRRDITDALLAWSGTTEVINPTWLPPEYMEPWRYKRLSQLMPVISVGALVGSLAGYESRGRLKTVWIDGSEQCPT
jgi:hypothetical protein